MWVEIFSTLFTALSALIVSIALYRRENAGKTRFAIFIVSLPIVNFVLNITLPHYISVGAFVIFAALLCKTILCENSITSLASAMIIAFFHRVMMLIYFSAVYILARECFTYGMRCFYSMLYAMVFLNITAFAAMWFYEKYRNIKYITEKAVSIIKSLDFLVLNPKLFGSLYVMLSITDTLFIAISTKVQIDCGNNAFYVGALFLVAMYSILMVLTMSMLQGLLKNEVDLIAKRDEVETLKNYTATIENLLDEMQKSRHDYKNMILSMRDFVEEKRFDELEQYFGEEILKSETLEKISKNIYLSTKKIKQLPLKSLINAKLNEAMNGGIKVEITIFFEIDITSVPTLDLCRIIGNLLDNAVEAASLSDNKVISLVMLENDNQYSITLCNSFSGEIDMSKIWKKGYSSKGKNRGQGLPIVKKLIDSHPEILINTEIKNNLFVQDLTITK